MWESTSLTTSKEGAIMTKDIKDIVARMRNKLDKFYMDYDEVATGHNGAKFYFNWDKQRNAYRKFIGVDDEVGETCAVGKCIVAQVIECFINIDLRDGFT